MFIIKAKITNNHKNKIYVLQTTINFSKQEFYFYVKQKINAFSLQLRQILPIFALSY